MSNNNGIITRPVNQRDVQQVLSISSSINKWSQLCTHADLNIWAKYRPKKYAAKGIMDQYDFANECWKVDSVWWKGNNGNMCFTPYVTTDFANVIANTNGGMNGWVFDGVPNGGTYPYRIADFIGYNHNALPIAADFSVPNEVRPHGELQVQCNFSIAGGDGVALGDFSTQLYFGFAFLSGSAVVYHGTASTPLEAFIRITDLPLAGDNRYLVYPFLCTEAITPTTMSMGNHTYWTIPCLDSHTCHVKEDTYSINATARWRFGTPGTAVITVSNGATQAVAISMFVRRTGRGWAESPLRDEGNYSHNPATLAGESESFYTVSAGSEEYTYHAIVTVNGQVVADTPVFNESPLDDLDI